MSRTAVRLDSGDRFPTTTLALSDGTMLTVPDDVPSRYRVILFYRGHWGQFCRRQLDAFESHNAEFRSLGAQILAASADPQHRAQEVAAALSFPVAYGVSREIADRIGAWWDPDRGIVQPAEFIVGGDGAVISATYSSGPIGRVSPTDAIKFIKFLETRRNKGA